MTRQMRPVVFSLLSLLAIGSDVFGQDKKSGEGPPCARPVDDYFAKEVWTKVGATLCVQCHKVGGDAEESKLILKDPRKVQGHAKDDAMLHNRDMFCRLARVKAGDKSRLLVKVSGGLEHGGGDVLKPESKGYSILSEFVRRLEAPVSAKPTPTAPEKETPFFDKVTMLPPDRLLRRVTLSLAGRLPTDAEKAAVAAKGHAALASILDDLMKEDAFYERLREGFNDIFVTLGINGALEAEILAYDYFNKTRLWTQKYDLSKIADEKERRQVGYKMVDEYRKALLGEPMKLIENIVKNDHPFTEIVTADYIMVTPYSARGYGVFDELKDKFKNPDDPFEYVPVKLKALVGRVPQQTQKTPTGFYAHAGLLTTFQYLRRYPTTETNRNRLRSRMFYLHFLGVDALELAARVSDAAEVSKKYPIPTMQASECVVCHKTVDPVAGLFQDFYNFDGTYGPRKEGWYKDMFEPGFEGEKMDPSEKWRALQWLGERTAKDPRFAVAMTEHVYYILTGRKVLREPKDLDDPLNGAKRRAFQEQRREIEAIAAKLTKSGFNLKTAFKEWIASDFYRVDGIAVAATDPHRKAELDDVGLSHMLSPEQVERKVQAIFGKRWGKLGEPLSILYGGIDSREVTERATDPSGAMGSIQRTLANDVACKNTLRDFARKPAERKLFPDIEPDVLPDVSAEADAKIKKTIVHLHELVLGRIDALDSAEVTRTFELFAGILADAKEQKKRDNREAYACRTDVPGAPDDPHYTIRAWRGVLTYLLRRPEFLYE